MQRNSANAPAQSITVDFVRLSELGEYESLKNLLTCKLCDSITVIFPLYDIRASFKIVRTEWDVLADRYNEMELGSLRTTLSQALGIGEQTSNGASNGETKGTPYGICSTASRTPAKTVTVSPPIDSLEVGTLVNVKFDNANSVANPTLNVNGTGAYAIKRYGSTAPSTSATSSWNAGSVCALVYDGIYWQMVGWQNTTYSSMTVAEYEAGTGTTARTITPARLKGAILHWAMPIDKIVTGSYVYNGEATTTITFTDSAINGKTHIICGCQDAGNPPLRATISGTTITVYVATSVTVMRVNYICY